MSPLRTKNKVPQDMPPDKVKCGAMWPRLRRKNLLLSIGPTYQCSKYNGIVSVTACPMVATLSGLVQSPRTAESCVSKVT